MEHTTSADLAIVTDKYPWKNHCAGADTDSRADESVGKNHHRLTDDGATIYCSSRAYTTAGSLNGSEYLENFREGDVGVRAFEKVKRGPAPISTGHAGRDDDCARPALRQKLLITRIGKKAYLARLCFVERSDFVNRHTAVADDSSSHMIGELDKRFGDRHLLLCPAIVALDDFVGDVRGLVAV